MKGDSEARVRKALGGIDRKPLVIKLPDDSRNWKPADFLVLEYHSDAFVEVKDNPQLGTWPLSDLRPSQRLGISEAHRVGVPYWLVIWWRRRRRWTISDGWKVMMETGDGSRTFEWLASVAGIDTDEEHLSSTLRAVLDGETQ